MIRNVNLEEISDGRIYQANDMVKADTNGCKGCFKCCTMVGDTIVLTAFDVYQIRKVTGSTFQELLNEKKIELNIVDGLILPNLAISEAGGRKGCSFLNEENRCSIHMERPDICRLFPLGRIYNEDGSYGYIIQKDQCVKKDLAKIKVKKWIGIDNFARNQEFVVKWHRFIKETGAFIIELKKAGKGELIRDITLYVLNELFIKEYEFENIENITDINVYEAIENRADEVAEYIKKFA